MIFYCLGLLLTSEEFADYQKFIMVQPWGLDVENMYDINIRENSIINEMFDINWASSTNRINDFYLSDYFDDIQLSSAISFVNGVGVQHSVYFRGEITEDYLPKVNPIHVNISSGSDETGNGTESSPFASIQRGVDRAESGDTVIVHPGTYIENVSVSEKVVHLKSLYSYQPGQEYLIDVTVINGNLDGSSIEFVYTGGYEYSSINGFTITVVKIIVAEVSIVMVRL